MSHDHDSVEADIIQIITEKVNRQNIAIGLDTELVDLGIESLDIVEIIFAIEEKYGIEIPFNANASAATDFSTPRAVITAVRGLLSDG
jgi:acyl carrier protein